MNFSTALGRGQHMNTNAAIFQYQTQTAVDGENNSHYMGAYYPALLAACHSFHTQDGAGKEIRALIWKYVSQHNIR